MTARLRSAIPPAARFGIRGLFGWHRRLAGRLRQRQRLAELDDRMLRDIGVSRAQVEAEMRKPWWTLLRRTGL